MDLGYEVEEDRLSIVGFTVGHVENPEQKERTGGYFTSDPAEIEDIYAKKKDDGGNFETEEGWERLIGVQYGLPGEEYHDLPEVPYKSFVKAGSPREVSLSVAYRFEALPKE